MSKAKFPYTSGKLTDILSFKGESSTNGTLGKKVTFDDVNSNSKNNVNISRTNYDIEYLDINSDGDTDESEYHDLI